jgi:hypothetical protein
MFGNSYNHLFTVIISVTGTGYCYAAIIEVTIYISLATVHSFSYEAGSLLTHEITSHKSGVGTAFSQSLQLQFGSGMRSLYHKQFSVVMFYHLAIASLA